MSTSPLQFIAAQLSVHRAELLELNVEYFSWVVEQVERQFGVTAQQVLGLSAAEYVPTVIDQVCGASPPQGIFYLLTSADRLAGMGGVRRIDARTAEIKRMYLRPQFRGHGFGDLLLKQLLGAARSFGYSRVCLDSGLFMHAAQRLYAHNGFKDCARYPGVEVPVEFRDRWRYMEREL